MTHKRIKKTAPKDSEQDSVAFLAGIEFEADPGGADLLRILGTRADYLKLAGNDYVALRLAGVTLSRSLKEMEEKLVEDDTETAAALERLSTYLHEVSNRFGAYAEALETASIRALAVVSRFDVRVAAVAGAVQRSPTADDGGPIRGAD